jgi:hypothetical protein
MVKKGGGDDQDQPRSDIIKPSSSSSSTAQQATGGNILHTTPSQQLQQQPQLQSQPSHTAATSIPTRRPQEQSSEPDRLSQTELPASTPLRHQVIAVSASKGPAAFFNLARKFLVTDEFCDLSALEGAIVSAVDAAHLLERSKLADIVRCVFFTFFLFFPVFLFFFVADFMLKFKLNALIHYFYSPHFLFIFLEFKHPTSLLSRKGDHNKIPLNNQIFPQRLLVQQLLPQ